MKVGGQHFRTIWLKPGAPEVVQLIDQRFLPHQFIVEEITTVAQMARAIREMHVRGAGLIGAAAGYGMYLAALESARSVSMQKSLTTLAGQLRETRPTAMNLAWAIDRQMKSIAGGKD